MNQKHHQNKNGKIILKDWLELRNLYKKKIWVVDKNILNEFVCKKMTVFHVRAYIQPDDEGYYVWLGKEGDTHEKRCQWNGFKQSMSSPAVFWQKELAVE